MAKVKRSARTRKVIKATEKQSVRAVSAAIEAGEATMHRLVPKDTGFLDSTIESTDDGNGHGEIRVDADYGIPVEFGTGRAAAKPYFRPGLDDAKRTLRQNLKIVEK